MKANLLKAKKSKFVDEKFEDVHLVVHDLVERGRGLGAAVLPRHVRKGVLQLKVDFAVRIQNFFKRSCDKSLLFDFVPRINFIYIFIPKSLTIFEIRKLIFVL